MPTLDGKVNLKARWNAAGQSFDCGKGIPHLRAGKDGPRGDQMVGALEVPRKLNDEQRELVESIRNAGRSKIHPEKQSFFDKVKDLAIDSSSKRI